MKPTPLLFPAVARVSFLTDPIGLYLHIPFCRKKCAYCDFYSAVTTESGIDAYVTALIAELSRWGKTVQRPVDTVYFGGGTPSLLGERVLPLLDAVRENFSVLPDAEVAAEINPSDDAEQFLTAAKEGGVNRLSVGLQSGINRELEVLGRTHTAETARQTVETARALGFANLSLDLMLGLPDSTTETLDKTIDLALSLHPEHLSAYLLKIEPKTRFFAECDRLNLPDDDAQAEQYLHLCDRLRHAGFEHYEISNFARPGFRSRHNTRYWTDGEYLGIGPAAHSYLCGKRFYYSRDLKAFCNAPATNEDGTGGDTAEKILLGLRLSDGVDLSAYPKTASFLEQLERTGLGVRRGAKFALTDRGMLVSNGIIAEILENLS